MVRRSREGANYPDDWPIIANQVKARAGWRCIRCGTAHGRPPAVLTVHHLDLDPSNAAWWKLLALCQRCHLSVQARVILERPWVMEHSDWFKAYAAAWYAKRYLGLDLSREAVAERLDELLALERRAVLGEVPA